MSPEAWFGVSPGGGEGLAVSVVKLLCDRRGQVLEELVRSDRVEEVDPLEGGDLDMSGVAPGAVPVDLLGLERADRGLGEGVIVGVPDGPDRGVDAGLNTSLLVKAIDVYCDPASNAPRARSGP